MSKNRESHMKTKETIAVIGATVNTGHLISRNLAVSGYRLLLMSPDREKLASLKAEILSMRPEADIDVSECEKSASWESDFIILACTKDSEKEIANKIKQFATGKVVVSITTPLQNTQFKSNFSLNTSFAEQLQRRLPYSKVVTAFDTSYSSYFNVNAKPDMLIASNSGNALEVALRILDAAGFNPVIVGDLSVSKTLESMQPTLLKRKLQ